MRATLVILTAATAALLAACADVSAGRPSAGSTSPSGPRPVVGCGTVPTSTGQLARLARLTVQAPATAAPGEQLAVAVRLSAHADTPRLILTPGTSALLVVRRGEIVGRTARDRPGPRIPIRLSAGEVRRAQAVPASVRLVGCHDAAPLPPGQYRLVAVLGYEVDSLNTAADGAASLRQRAHSFDLVSSPASITVA